MPQLPDIEPSLVQRARQNDEVAIAQIYEKLNKKPTHRLITSLELMKDSRRMQKQSRRIHSKMHSKRLIF